jgi:endonuclease-3 related protein
MKTTRELLLEIYRLLLDFFGPQHWWPGETPFEVAVGAILTQNTSWTNVAKAITNLKAAGCLDPIKLHKMDAEPLELLIRPAGYFRVKAKRLKNFIYWLCDHCGGDLQNLQPTKTARLREELLAVSGIGPETADSILLYAGERPVFVIDAYTRRVLARHGFPRALAADYEELRARFESRLPRSVRLYNEFHALFVRVGKERCAKRSPRCAGCPLARIEGRRMKEEG